MDSFILNLLWSILNFAGVIVSLKVAYQKPIFRLSERVQIKDTIMVKLVINSTESLSGKLLDISEQGVGIMLDKGLNLSINTDIDLVINDITFKCILRKIQENTIGLQFKELSAEQMQLIMKPFTENMQPYFLIDKKKIINYKN